MEWNSNLETQAAERPLATSAELHPQIERARELRAAALAGAFHAVARPARAVIGGAARWWQRRATGAALLRCNDRVLADIGIAREEIPMVARGLEPSPEPAPASALGRRWPAMLAHVEVLAMIRQGASHGWLGRHPQTLADRG
jgi:uncharacterized protein YjiS (DUF1127 family)